MKFTDFGVAIIEEDTHLSKWIVEQGRLDVQALYCSLFKKYIPEGGIVCDVGACLGDHTLSYSKMVGERGHVFAYEPNKVAFECLAHNMRHFPNVTTYQCALGASDGRCQIRNPSAPGSPYNLGGVEIRASGRIGEMEMTTLDYECRHWPRLDFIKIDAEGSEPEIILGAVRALKQFRPVLLVEINRPCLQSRNKTPENVLVPLQALNYSVQPSEPHLSFDLDYVDALCIPKEQL